MQRRRTFPEASISAAAAKKRYYTSPKGKLQKRKEDHAFQASGGRAKAEAKRAAVPLTEARMEARLRYQLQRRAKEKVLSELDAFVLSEAVRLRKARDVLMGFAWHVDHVVPVSKGGSSCAGNLQVVPALWNRQKSNLHSERFFAHAKGIYDRTNHLYIP